MIYAGSKAKLAKKLLPVILANRGDRVYVEPFVGGGNMIDKVTGVRMGGDSNKYMVALLIAIRDGWVPPTEVTRDEYRDIKNNPNYYPPELVGFIGGPGSFGGKWFGGYCNPSTSNDNYYETGSRSCAKKRPLIQGVQFHHCSYDQLPIPDNSLIYCDPPYRATIKYQHEFDSDKFFEWCRIKASQGHQIFVSEYTAPDDFKCVLEISHKTTMNRNISNPRTERLFTL